MKQLTLERAKKLQYGDIVFETENNKKWRITGKVKLWKKDTNRIRIPVKYGLYTYGHIEENNLHLLLIDE